MTESPARYDITALHIHNTHQSDCGFCADINARLVALEREREEDRQAIRALTEACDQMLGENSDCTSLRVLRPYVAAIQRAQERP